MDIISYIAEANILHDNTQSGQNVCKDQHITFQNGELWDHLREPVMAPKNLRVKSVPGGRRAPGDAALLFGARAARPDEKGRSLGPLRGGDGVVVVRDFLGRTTGSYLGVRTFTSKAGLGNQAKRGSDIKKSPYSKSFKEISMKRIANIKNLVSAYELIKSNPVNMTQGIGEITLDGINLKYFEKTQAELKAGTYSFPPAIRVEIPNPGKKQTIPLTIAAPRDKVVQKAMQMVMEPEYEKIFMESSHGFRPNKGTRTALQYLEAKFQSVHYIIEADFSKLPYESLPHNKRPPSGGGEMHRARVARATLMEILKKRINCEKTLRLIISSLKAGFVELGKLHEQLGDGTPQGSVLSPLLCNIYLHELDVFIEELKLEYNKGERRKKNKEYERLGNKIKYISSHPLGGGRGRKMGYDTTRADEHRELTSKMLNTPSKRQDESYIRIHYVRYADDFIIGVEGSHKLTHNILQRLRKFIEEVLGLKLNDSKTGITKFSDKAVDFLGYKLMPPHKKGAIKPMETLKEKKSDRTITRRNKIRIRVAMDSAKV
jgi:retron-type reverse transcriptase